MMQESLMEFSFLTWFRLVGLYVFLKLVAYENALQQTDDRDVVNNMNEDYGYQRNRTICNETQPHLTVYDCKDQFVQMVDVKRFTVTFAKEI